MWETAELSQTCRGPWATERRERVEEVLAKVGMTVQAKHYSAQLSGGQQQRVEVSRALGGRPSILLADEPTGNLGSKNGEAVMVLLRELHVQRTVQLFDGRIVERNVAVK